MKNVWTKTKNWFSKNWSQVVNMLVLLITYGVIQSKTNLLGLEVFLALWILGLGGHYMWKLWKK